MLILSRKEGEVIRIGDNIKVMIVRNGPNTVRVGIDAPREIQIVREELEERDYDAEVQHVMEGAGR